MDESLIITSEDYLVFSLLLLRAVLDGVLNHTRHYYYCFLQAALDTGSSGTPSLELDDGDDDDDDDDASDNCF